MNARSVAINTHPWSLTIGACRLFQGKVAESTSEAIRLTFARFEVRCNRAGTPKSTLVRARTIHVSLTRTIGAFATRSAPSWLAFALAQSAVAITMATARFTKGHSVFSTQVADTWSRGVVEARAIAGAARVFAKLAPEALRIVADAHVAVVGTNVGTLGITRDAVVPSFARAVARILRDLLTVNAANAAVLTHPVPGAVDAANSWSISLRFADASSEAVVWAIRNVTGHTLPAGPAVAGRDSSVAVTMTSAVGVVVARTAGQIAQLTAEALEEVADAFAADDLTVAATLLVATITSPAGMTNADATVERDLITM